MSGGAVLQIVPRLPPPSEGVGSFAQGVAGALLAGPGIASRLLAAGPGEPGAEPETRAFAARRISGAMPWAE